MKVEGTNNVMLGEIGLILSSNNNNTNCNCNNTNKARRRRSSNLNLSLKNWSGSASIWLLLVLLFLTTASISGLRLHPEVKINSSPRSNNKSPGSLHHRRALLVRGGDTNNNSNLPQDSPLLNASEAPSPSIAVNITSNSTKGGEAAPLIPLESDTDETKTTESPVAVTSPAVSSARLGELQQKVIAAQQDQSQQSQSGTTMTKQAAASPSGPSSLRSAVFPIYGDYEVRKFLLLGSLKFCIVLALVLTRDCKDTLVVTQIGAEAIAFLKVYGVLPAATAFIGLYTKMSNNMSKRQLFYATAIPFFVFFALFDAVLYPNRHLMEPSLETVQRWMHLSPSSTGGSAVVAGILSHWTSALFYIVAEVYSSASISILFWQFANDVVSIQQAPRMYPLFAQMSGLAPIFAGQYVVRYASQASDFAGSLHRLTILISSAGVGMCTLYALVNRFLDTHPDPSLAGVRAAAARAAAEGGAEKEALLPKKKKKQKMTMMDSAKFLASSQYLRLMGILVIGYGLSINFTEIMWKSLVKKQYPDALEYQRYMGNFSSILGISTCLVIFLGVHVIRILGWKAGALSTPVIMAVLAVPFFGCVFMGLDSPARLSMAVTIGAVQSLLSKTGKYAMFDPTTQMAYIPLDDESKVKGKAAIDVLGSRIGKSGGSLIQQTLVMIFGGNILNAAPVVMVIFYGVLLSWMDAARRLSYLFVAKTAMKEAEKKE
jgi:AAA family ATP:ADP antiporter